MSRISVIIPIYNAEKYIEKCIRSILDQSYQDFEIILIDDGSTDGSAGICSEYAAEFQQISVFHTKNGGPAAARKYGVEHARGNMIMFVDADDWLAPSMLAFAVSKMQDMDADIVCIGHKEVDEKGQAKGEAAVDWKEIMIKDSSQAMTHLHGTRYIDSGPWAKLIKKSLFTDVDFCTEVTIGEDYFMILQLLEKADKTVLCREQMYFRCIRETSISRSGYSERHKRAFDYYMNWRLYLIEKYPELKKEIIGYHAEYEMAVLTAMCRNKQYDRSVIQELKKDLKENRKIIWKCRETPFYMRVSAMMIAYCCPVFIILFRFIHVLTGR